jgi:hypothetical protein
MHVIPEVLNSTKCLEENQVNACDSIVKYFINKQQ